MIVPHLMCTGHLTIGVANKLRVPFRGEIISFQATGK